MKNPKNLKVVSLEVTCVIAISLETEMYIKYSTPPPNQREGGKSASGGTREPF